MKIKVYKRDQEVIWEGEVKDFPLILGRQPPCSLVVGAKGVSSQHLEITKDDQKFFIRDLGSRNGTYIGKEKIGYKPISLPVTVRLGANVFVDLSADECLTDEEIGARSSEAVADVATGVSIGLASAPSRKRKEGDIFGRSLPELGLASWALIWFAILLPLIELMVFSREKWERILIAFFSLLLPVGLSLLLRAIRLFFSRKTNILLMGVLFWCFFYWVLIFTSTFQLAPMAFDWSPGLIHYLVVGFAAMVPLGFFGGFAVGGRYRIPLGMLTASCSVLLFAFVLSLPVAQINVDLKKREAFFENKKLDFWSGRELSSTEFAHKIRNLDKKTEPNP